MKLRRDSAEARMFQGVMAQAPRMAQMYWARRRFRYFGKMVVRSTATEMLLAEMLMAMLAIRKARAQKKAAARPPRDVQSIRSEEANISE
jgi:hypothetical protein